MTFTTGKAGAKLSELCGSKSNITGLS